MIILGVEKDLIEIYAFKLNKHNHIKELKARGVLNLPGDKKNVNFRGVTTEDMEYWNLLEPQAGETSLDKVVSWVIARQGPNPIDDLLYCQEILNKHNFSTLSENCMGTLVHGMREGELEDVGLLEELLFEYATRKNIQYNPRSIGFKNYEDDDGYEGVLITVKENS